MNGLHEMPTPSDFDVSRLTTDLEWSDVLLPEEVIDQLVLIAKGIEHAGNSNGERGFGKTLKAGFFSIFHGASGTGKTLTAALLGKQTGRDVYRVDLAKVMLSYIGETEKNLSKLFDKASQNGWILVFDEADALFGKRSEIKDSHDRYANQEVSYLLQRIEDFDGVVILASNSKDNLDDSLMRRAQFIIPFPMPDVSTRLTIWRKALAGSDRFDPRIDVKRLAQDFEISGGGIVHAVEGASLDAFHEGNKTIDEAVLRRAITRESK